MVRGLTSTKLGVGCLTLFALPFAGVGVATLYLLGSALVASVRMSDWVEVPAVITHAELKANRGGAGKGGGTSYQAAARYTYEVGGRRYEGDRVSPHGGSDNIGSFQSDVHAELLRHQNERTPFRCFVNGEQARERGHALAARARAASAIALGQGR